MRYIIGDTESTGLGADRKACEAALMEIDPDTLEILGTMDSILNPERLIESGAMAIHGITDEQAAAAPTMEQWLLNELEGPLDGEITLIGYRVAFDYPMLLPIGNIVRTFDILPMVQMMVPAVMPRNPTPGNDKPNRKLQTMCEYFDIEPGEAHRAMSDVHSTYQLLLKLLPYTRRTLRDMCNTPFQMWYRMPWGKHEDEPLITLPVRYKEWILSQPEIDPNLKKSVRMFYQTDRVI